MAPSLFAPAPLRQNLWKKASEKYKRLTSKEPPTTSHSNMADEVATAEETQKADEEVQNSSKDESKEPATVTGVVVKGVVNWFNVAKGFGELAFVAPIPARAFFFLVRHGCGPRVPAGPPGLPSNELAAPNGNVTRRSRTSRTRRDAPRRVASPSPASRHLREKKRFEARCHANQTILGNKLNVLVAPLPRRIRDARRRRRRRVRTPERHLRGGFPQLA